MKLRILKIQILRNTFFNLFFFMRFWHLRWIYIYFHCIFHAGYKFIIFPMNNMASFFFLKNQFWNNPILNTGTSNEEEKRLKQNWSQLDPKHILYSWPQFFGGKSILKTIQFWIQETPKPICTGPRWRALVKERLSNGRQSSILFSITV